MKTIALLLGAFLSLSLAACGDPFTAEVFSEPGQLGDAGAAGDETQPLGAAGDSSGGAGAPSTPEAGSAGAPSTAGGAASAGAGAGGSVVVAAGAGGGLPPIAPPCEDAADLSGFYFAGVTGKAMCLRTKESFNVIRLVGGGDARTISVNGGPVLQCSSEPSDVWSSVCTFKIGDAARTDAEGYRYIQIMNTVEFAGGAMRWATEPSGEPCENAAFGYSVAAHYDASDRVTAACESDGTCEYRCLSQYCSGISAPQAPKWELIKSCPDPK